MRIVNTDSSSESAMNIFLALLIAKLDIPVHGNRHAAYLDFARLEDAEKHLDQIYLRNREREIIKSFLDG